MRLENRVFNSDPDEMSFWENGLCVGSNFTRQRNEKGIRTIASLLCHSGPHRIMALCATHAGLITLRGARMDKSAH